MDPFDNHNVLKFRFEEGFKNIRLNLMGTTGVLYEDPNFYFNLESPNLKWSRPKEITNHPVFIDGKPSRFDALQGHVGDCWLASSIEAITLNDKLIKHVVPPDQSFDHNYIGAFHFRIWKLGAWVDVVVDDRLPVTVQPDQQKSGDLYYMHSRSGNVFWAALLEKAYAKFYGTSSYKDPLEAGLMKTSLQDLSGGILVISSLRALPPQTTPEWLLREVFSKNTLMGCHFWKEDLSKGILSGHSYCVTKVYRFPQSHPHYAGKVIVKLMNPYGKKEWRGAFSDWDDDTWRKVDDIGVEWREDGEFWMPLEEFVARTASITLCFLGPGQYLSAHRKPTSTHVDWNTRTLYGEWVHPFSTGNFELKTRHLNPQYLIELQCPKHSKDGCHCCTVIEVTHRSKKRGRNFKPLLAFYIYDLNKFENKSEYYIHMPLDQNFFKHNVPLDKNPIVEKSHGRSYVTSMQLHEGKFCIIPFTREAKAESNFCLRIISESRILNAATYDGTLSKSAPTEVQKEESDHALRRRFDVAARGRDELDWIGLKEVLDVIFIPNHTYFWFIGVLITFIRNISGIYISNLRLIGLLHNFILAVSGVHIPLLSNKDVMVFTKNECRSMIAMLDVDHSGKLCFSEFSNLWNKIWFWKKVYYQYIDEAEGCVTVAQLRDAISSIGFNIPKRIVHSLSFVYADDAGNIRLTDFILCGVALETAMSFSQKKNLDRWVDITMTSDDWVKNTLMM